MTIAVAPQSLAPSLADRAAFEAVIAQACNRIAPLWPLKHFVAVNPYLGFSGQAFASTAACLRRVTRTSMLMPRGFYREALAAGSFGDADITAAIANAAFDAPKPADAAGFRAALAAEPAPRPAAVVATVAEVLDRLAAGDRQASRTAFMVDEISKWCAAWFDDGQAAWKLPELGMQPPMPPYAAWRAAMRHDRNPEAMGIRHFRQTIAELPADPIDCIMTIVEAHGIPERVVVDYLHRALFDIGGWAAYARYKVWNDGLYGRPNDTLVQLLAIRMAWGHALFREREDDAFTAAWAAAMRDAAALPATGEIIDADLAVDLIAQDAYEAGFRRRLLAKLALPEQGAELWPEPRVRKPLQAAFCIDVRSEVFRRALETVCPQAQTLGFAGFFGYPIEYVPIGRDSGGAQCPVLLTPAYTVCEHVKHAGPEEETEILGLRLMRRRAVKAWKSFKLSAVSSFTYVETMGLAFAPKLVGDALGLTRTVADPHTDGLDPQVVHRRGPRLAPQTVGGRQTGFTPDQALNQAEAVLRAMSLTRDFARLVMLAGHGSTTANNPHASGLDCGACGGHTGEANARVAAAILNDAEVRQGLRGRGIHIPHDTWFLGALHDTTTDEVTLFDLDLVPIDFAAQVSALELWLAEAGRRARAERAGPLGLAGAADVDQAVRARSRDWAQVRPEWGLAGNAAFIAAPRSRTRGIDLGGRAFLHDYDWRQDGEAKILTLIMTAPMVVASWINLQYWGSVVNNRVWGAGNKVLHNVVGQLGVLEGNAGDLKTGLAWQSVHDGEKFIHEPLRLNVFIESPRAAMDAVIAANAGIRDLLDNRWLHLHAIDEHGVASHRYLPGGGWSAL